MKTNSLRTLATLAALALLAPLGMVQAQDVQLASHAEMNDLYGRLAELESRVAASNVSGCGCADTAGNGCGCDNGCGNDCGDDCCGCPGFVAGAEILWLKPFSSNGLFGTFDYEEGFRAWIGYQGAGGLGIRVRDFEYFQRAANGDLVDISTIDIEVYDAVQLGCNWDLNIGGGLRNSNMHVNFPADIQFWGTGPVVSAELYRHISDRAALYAQVHESILVGDGREGGVLVPDRTVMVSEIQIGGQIHREYNGGLLFARGGWEAQFYKDFDDIEESMSLSGFTASVGLMR